MFCSGFDVTTLKQTVHCKKAAIVAVFFLYLLYSTVTALLYFLTFRRKDSKWLPLLSSFKRDIEQLSFFYLAFALLISIVCPVPFGVAMLYVYLLTFPALMVGHVKKEKWVIRLAAIGGQVVIMIIVIFFVLINSWCRHYFFRYIPQIPSEMK